MRAMLRRLCNPIVDRLRPGPGQVIVIVAICMVAFLGMVGLVVDVGELYVTQRHLQTAADAAALAAARDLPNSTVSACSYSASSVGSTTCTVNGTNVALGSNGENYDTNYNGVQTSAQVECLSVASAGLGCQTGTACADPLGYAPSGGPNNPGCNAIRLTEQRTVTPFFMGLLGFGGRTVSATATASIAGGIPHPLDVEMINDTTASMQTSDSCGGTPTDVPSGVSLTQEDCAKAGARAFLTTMFPCAQTLTSCGPFSNGQTTALGGPLDEVGMVTFPGLTSNGLLPDELDCTKQLGTGDTTYGGSAIYQVVPFSSDFRFSDASTKDPLATLNPSSNLVRSVYWPGDFCPNGGYPIPGGATSSIGGGGAGDYSTANNNASAIAGGAGAANDSTTALNGGIGRGSSTSTTNATGVVRGSSTSTTTSALTIGGGPNSGSSRDYRTASTASGTSLQISAPQNTVSGDFLLVTVTGQGSSMTGSSRICDPTGNWTLVDKQVSSASATAVIQATFSGLRTTVGAGPYSFDFDTGVGTCGQHPLTLSASAVALRYTNVTGVDKAAGAFGAPAFSNLTGSAPSTTWSTANEYVSVSAACVSSTSTSCTTTPAAAGTVTRATFTFSANIGATQAYSVNLLKNGASVASCTVAGGTNGCTMSGLAVAVNGSSDTVVLRVAQTAGATSFTGTATTTAVESVTTNTNFAGSAPNTTFGTATEFVSLSTSCANTNVATCDDANVAAAGTITSATLTFNRNVTSASTLTLYRNGVSTGSTCPIAAGSSTCTISPSLAVAVNDKLELGVARSSGSQNLRATTAAVESVTTNTNFAGSAPAATTWGTTNEYVSVAAACVSSTAANCTTTPATAGTITSATLTFSANIGATQAYSVNLLKNGASVASCTVGGGTNGCTMSGLAVAVNGTSDTIELSVAQTAGATSFAGTATTGAVKATGGTTLNAPPVLTTTANDQVVSLFGTGSTFAAGNGLPVTIAGSSTSTGADDAAWPTVSTTPGESVNSSAPDDWVAQTVALSPALPSSITVATPGGYAAGSGFVLTTIAVSGLGSGAVCPAAGWHQVMAPTVSPGSGTAQETQESFWSNTVAPGNYTFTFYPSASCTGTPVGAGASEATVNYTGVDQTTPLDSVTPQSAAGPPPTGLPPAAVTTRSANDELVGLFATDATTLTAAGGIVQNGSSTSSGINDQVRQVPGSATPPSASSTPAGANWTEETLALRPALSSSITITPPPDYAGTTGDFLLVSIAAQNLGSGSICPPAAAPTWNPIATTTSGSGSTELTQATFWTTLSTASSDTFTFYPSSSCSGTPVGAGASAVATTYTGVDVATAPISSLNQGSGTTLTAQQLSTKTVDNEVVSLFASNAAFSNPLPSVHNPSSAWTNSGEEAALQRAIGNQPTPATETTAPNAANWTAVTVALTPLLNSSITISPPAGYVGGGADLMLVSIGVQNLGTGSICPPDSTWTPVPVSSAQPITYTVTSGTLTQEAFWTTTSTAGSDTFQFYKGSSCAGSPLPAGASAVALNYTGVNPAAPLDGTPVTAQGAASPLLPGHITTTAAGDMVVGLFATNDSTLSGTTVATPGGDLTNSGANNTLEGAAGSYVPASATSSPGPASWTSETIALRPLGTTGVTIARPPTPAANDFLLVTVTAKGLTGSGNSICAPNDGSWTQLGSLVTQGTISQATFYSARASASAESYSFNFQSGACPAGGAPLSASASAIAVRYSGVNPITPIDTDASANLEYAKSSGNNTTIAPPSVTPQRSGDEVVGLYGAAVAGLPSPVLHYASSSAPSATGYWDVNAPPAGSASTPPHATIASNNWIGQTVALESAYGSCGSNCQYGMEDPGGSGTDYGLAIHAAEAQLESLASSDPNRATAQKVIILLSDGDANTQDGGVTLTPCQYGIQQAEAAENQGTWVFAIAYGANYDQTGHATAKSCTYDASSGNLAGLSAQCAMILMADNSVSNKYNAVSNPGGYTNDAAAKAALCDSPPNTYAPSDPPHKYYNESTGSSLEAVFQEVGVALTTPRLVSNNAA